MSTPSILSKDTLVPLGLVIALAGWAFSLGIQTQKIENLREDMQDVKTQLVEINKMLLQRSVASN
jgi:hypothetical protein